MMSIECKFTVCRLPPILCPLFTKISLFREALREACLMRTSCISNVQCCTFLWVQLQAFPTSPKKVIAKILFNILSVKITMQMKTFRSTATLKTTKSFFHILKCHVTPIEIVSKETCISENKSRSCDKLIQCILGQIMLKARQPYCASETCLPTNRAIQSQLLSRKEVYYFLW